MTTPEERERRKYRRQRFERQFKLAYRIGYWLPVAFVVGVGLLIAIFANA